MATDAGPLDRRAFGLACGILWSGAVVLLGIAARFGWGNRWRRLLADVYRGYDESVTGLVIGGTWAFVDGFVGGNVFAWLYGRLLRRRPARGMRSAEAPVSTPTAPRQHD